MLEFALEARTRDAIADIMLSIIQHEENQKSRVVGLALKHFNFTVKKQN